MTKQIQNNQHLHLGSNPQRMPAVHSLLLWAFVLLCLLPNSVSSFGWLRVNTLSERLMGSRPEWIRHNNQLSNTRQGHHRSSSSSSSLSYSSSPNEQPQQQSTKRDQASMVEFINEPNGAMVGSSDMDPLTPLDMDTANLLQCIVQAADGRKAADIVALKVHHVSTLTSVLVILSGNSRPQNQAIASAITKDVVEELDVRPNGSGIPEGSAESGWMLLDYGTVMVHIMTPKSRLFYNVQGQWLAKGAQPLDLSHMLLPNAPPPSGGSWDSSSAGAEESLEPSQQPAQDENDPFWS